MRGFNHVTKLKVYVQFVRGHFMQIINSVSVVHASWATPDWANPYLFLKN